MNNVFKEMLNDEHFNALNNTVRWNGATRLKDESVAHHSFLVAWFARIITEETFLYESEKLNIVTAAMFHDFDEMFSGDILFPVKYNSFNGEKIKKVIEEFNDHCVLEKFNKETKIDKMYRKFLITQNENVFVKSFIKLCDWLACLFYVYKEVAIGNTSMIERIFICEKKIQESAEKLCKLMKEFKTNYKTDLIEQLMKFKVYE